MSDLVTSTTQPPAGVPAVPSIPPSSVSARQLPGHLVSTGFERDNLVKRLFIHSAGQCTKNHEGHIFFYDAGNRAIDHYTAKSLPITLEEHGWFRDENMFVQIAKNHAVPNGLNPNATFVSWRNSLLAFLDTHYGGVGGQWTRIT